MIGIVTDSTCDIPDEMIRQYDITVIPHYIIWGNEQYRDRVDLQAEEFYRRLVTETCCRILWWCKHLRHSYGNLVWKVEIQTGSCSGALC